MDGWMDEWGQWDWGIGGTSLIGRVSGIIGGIGGWVELVGLPFIIHTFKHTHMNGLYE